MKRSSTSRPTSARVGLGALGLVAIALISLNLRPGATSVGPVLHEIQDALSLNGTVAGFMTSLPCLCFGIVGAFAVRFARRVGVTLGILLGVLAIVIGLGLRSLTGNAWVFLALSTFALAGMALGNILVPAWIKRHSLDGGVRGMSVYSTGLALGGSMGSLLSAPVEEVAPGGWRGALALWALVALFAVGPWVMLARRDRRDPGEHVVDVNRPAGRVRTSRTAIAMAIYFGMQSMNAYVQFGWLPQIYRDAGLSGVEAGVWLALLSGLGIVGGLIMPTIVRRRTPMTVAVLVFGSFLFLGYGGLWLAPSHLPWLWAILLGVSGWSFPAAIAMITARTRSAHITAQVSGFVQPIGYLIAALGPIVVGIVHQASGGWTLVLFLLMGTGVIMTSAGLVLARSGYVDDEISASAE